MALKDLFIEKEDSNEDLDLSALTAGLDGLVDEGVDAVDLDSATVADIVSEAYSANNLTDLTKSIFKVEELVNNFPKEMPTDTKRQTILGIMASFNLTPEEVVEDGENRIAILADTISQVKEDLDTANNTLELEIEDLKQQIAEKEQMIAANKNTIKNSTEAVDTETERVESLVKFIKGE